MPSYLLRARTSAANMIVLPALLRELIAGYGSFLFFHKLAPNLLLVAATLTEPRAGLLGLLSGVSTLATRRVLGLRPIAGGMDGLNGILAGLFLGATFAPGWKLVLLAVVAGPLTILVASWAGDRLALRRLPLLSGAFVGVGLLLFAVGRAIALPFAPYEVPHIPHWLAGPAGDFLSALGAIYLAPSIAGGALVFAAIAISSRTLVLLSVQAFVIGRIVLWTFEIPPSGFAGISLSTAAMLAAIMTGGVFARPGVRAFAVAAFGAVSACLISLAWQNAMWFVALPPLSLPYLIATWLIMMALTPERGSAWMRYWLPYPALPEQALEQRRQAEMRGLAEDSIALRTPFSGRWTIYQGFDGPHTHVAPRQHALDFHRLKNGLAFRGDGGRLEDYYAFNEPVLSPVYGWVTACRSDLPDNAPGEVNLADCWGNYVLIALASGEYVLLAHLRQGSVRVVPGEAVAPGQEFGRCGNSGRSPAPHLHMHVQTLPVLGAPTRPFHLAGAIVADSDGEEYSLSAIPGTGDSVWTPPANTALARALHWPVGRCLTYRTSARGDATTTLAVSLDSNGLFRLCGSDSASIAFVETRELVALYGRTGGDDAILDCFALALGLTPLVDGTLRWRDIPPLRLLPVSLPLRAMCWLTPALATTESLYERHWDATAGHWRQTGHHELRFVGRALWSCSTDVSISAEAGVTAMTITTDRDEAVKVEVRLNAIGMRGDQGIPEWTYELNGGV